MHSNPEASSILQQTEKEEHLLKNEFLKVKTATLNLISSKSREEKILEKNIQHLFSDYVLSIY